MFGCCVHKLHWKALVFSSCIKNPRKVESSKALTVIQSVHWGMAVKSKHKQAPGTAAKTNLHLPKEMMHKMGPNRSFQYLIPVILSNPYRAGSRLWSQDKGWKENQGSTYPVAFFGGSSWRNTWLLLGFAFSLETPKEQELSQKFQLQIDCLKKYMWRSLPQLGVYNHGVSGAR